MRDWKKNFIHNRFNYLLVTVLTLFIVSPFLQAKEATTFAPMVTAIYTAIVIAVLSTIIRNKKHFYFYAGVKLVFFILDMLVFYDVIHTFEYAIHMADFLVRIAFIMLFIWHLAIELFETKKVTSDTVKGGICVYIFIGILWASLYKLTYAIDPNAFSTSFNAHWNFFYFSFSTLLTTGYGDITAVSSFAMMLTCLEGLAGQIFLVVFISRLVGLRMKHSG